MSLPLNMNIANPNDPIALARYHMVEQQIRPWNVSDSAVLELLARVPREEFVPAPYRSLAFMDMEIPLLPHTEEAMRQGHCMLAPRVDARLFNDLQVQPHERILEIGAGSGYMAALLAGRAARVVSLEIHPELAQMARHNLHRVGIHNADVRQADGALDPIPDGPFDAIVLSGSVAEIPQQLLRHLKDGGRLIAIVGDEPMMRVTLVRRNGDAFESTQPWDTVAARLHGFTQPSRFAF